MALNRRILDKIKKKCSGNKNMLDYMYTIIQIEITEPYQYKTEYTNAIKKYAVREGGSGE